MIGLLVTNLTIFLTLIYAQFTSLYTYIFLVMKQIIKLITLVIKRIKHALPYKVIVNIFSKNLSK